MTLVLENNNKNPKFKDSDQVRISKFQKIFAKGCLPNWSEEVFVIKKVKKLCRGHMLLVILIVRKLLKRFVKKNCKRQINRV